MLLAGGWKGEVDVSTRAPEPPIPCRREQYSVDCMLLLMLGVHGQGSIMLQYHKLPGRTKHAAALHTQPQNDKYIQLCIRLLKY